MNDKGMNGGGRAMRDFMIVEEAQKQDNRPYKPDDLSSYLTRHGGSGKSGRQVR